jgi:antitoxin component of RelBE/YafQ-DinJ toxin-antitoxin module
MSAKKTESINVRVDTELKTVLDEIFEKQGVNPSELARRLLIAAIEIYRETGRIEFPIKVTSQTTKIGSPKRTAA